MSEVTPYVLAPTNLSELMEFSRMAANSSFVGSQMRGKPGDVLMAIQMGAEVGLNPMQAIQNIAVINSRPCLWGDAALAVVIRCSAYEYHKEFHTGTIDEGNRTAHCTVKRKGSEEHTVSFSMDDAKRANLWKKNTVWTQYPDRMLQMRARAFAIRDQFADALKGLAVREEVEDYNNEPLNKPSSMTVIDVTPKNEVLQIEVNPAKTDEQVMAEIAVPRSQLIDAVASAKDLVDLKVQFGRAYTMHAGRLELMKDIVELKEVRKKYLQDYNAAIQEGTFDDPLPSFVDTTDINKDIPQ